MPRQRQIMLIQASCLLLCLFLGLQLYWNRPVDLPGLSFTRDETRILQELNRRDGNADTIPANYEQEVVRLTGPKGASVAVIIKEGIVTPAQIGDGESWVRYLHDGDYLLIDPVDEKQNDVLRSHVTRRKDRDWMRPRRLGWRRTEIGASHVP